MRRFIIEQSEADLISHAGLGLIGMALNERTDLVTDANAAAPARSDAIPLTPLDNGRVPLDADVTPFDNSKTKKEGVLRTDKGMDGYAPMAAYLGQEGYGLELERREGKQHGQKDTPAFLERVLERARTLTDQPILLRLDGGNDAIENIHVVYEHNERNADAARVEYLIKWNPRKADPAHGLSHAEEHGR